MPSNQEFKSFIASLTPDQINFIGQIAINPGRQVEDPQTIEIRERVQREMAKEKAEATRKRKEEEVAAKARMLRVRTEKYIRLLDESKKAHEKAQLAEQEATEYKEKWGIELPAPAPAIAPARRAHLHRHASAAATKDRAAAVAAAAAAPEKTKPTKPLVKKVMIVEPEPEEAEESDEELDVEEITIDGVTYYKTEYGTLYDIATHEEIGHLVEGKVVKA